MTAAARITLMVTLADDVDPDSAAGEVFDVLASLPEGVCDRVESFDGYDFEVDE